MDKEELNLKYSIPPKGKGLVFKISIDNKYGGFYCNWSKYRFELCLGFAAFRVFFMSEERYDALQCVVTHAKICTSHDMKINRNQ